MAAIVQFILKHGYSILFAAIFAHQIGFPVPGPLFLLAAGALAATGRLSFATAVVLAILAAVLADWPWYEAGRHRGDKVLHFIHRLTRDPDSHDRRAKRVFARYGPSILLISKFVPGLDAVAPPLSGIFRTSRIRFLLFDGIGAGLYSCAYVALGYIFRHDLDHAAAYVGRVGTVLAGLALAAVFIYAGRRLVLRLRSIQHSATESVSYWNSLASLDSEELPPTTEGRENGHQSSREAAVTTRSRFTD